MTHTPTEEHLEFHGSPRPTIGVEVELALVDLETRALVSGADQLLCDVGRSHPEGVHPTAKHELFQCTVEAITGICTTVAEAGDDLRGTIAELDRAARPLGMGLVSVGTHPFSHWKDLEVSPDPRYGRIVERLGWPARRLAIHGMHVHVGVPTGEVAIAVTNALCEHLPVLLALSASSPYWHGEDTDMASVRTKVFECLPNAGLPPRVASWAEFEGFVHTLRHGGAIDTVREVWWDVRPHPGFGTVELRMCDAMATLGEVTGVAALAQCLVVDLQRRFEAGEPESVPREWVVDQNKWLASRHGTEAMLIVDDDGHRRPVGELVDDLVTRLDPVAAELGCTTELASARTMVERPGNVRQRDVVAAGGTLRDVVDLLADEFRGDAGYV